MSKLWTFLDFVDGNGTNLIHEWIQALPKEAKAKMTHRIELLEVVQQFTEPYTEILTGDCAGLFEIKFRAKRVQYRPLAFFGPERREVTLLAGATEKGGQLKPPSICATALSRKALVQTDRRHVCSHDFS